MNKRQLARMALGVRRRGMDPSSISAAAVSKRSEIDAGNNSINIAQESEMKNEAASKELWTRWESSTTMKEYAAVLADAIKKMAELASQGIYIDGLSDDVGDFSIELQRKLAEEGLFMGDKQMNPTAFQDGRMIFEADNSLAGPGA